jgi:hypothetical protein
MIFGYFTLFVALVISAVAAYYSIVGLTAIFSAAVIPIMIMGGALEVGKLLAAVWLKLNWHRARLTYKIYLVPAVAFLMLLTSMGIFGFLSKAHSDQTLVSGDSMSRVAIYDEKIRISKDNIDADRKALKQMDEAVDQVMGRSQDEKGADKAVALRRGQAKERTRLLADIDAEQKKISAFSEERAPLAAEFRKIEADVGPIKYIAAFIYGDNPDANILERAVRWVIILIVLVFDPLALVLILAAQQSIKWAQEDKEDKPDAWVADVGEKPIVEELEEPKYEADDGPLDDDIIDQIKKMVSKDLPAGEVVETSSLFDRTGEPCPKCSTPMQTAPGIGIFCPNKDCDVIDGPDLYEKDLPQEPHPPGWMYGDLKSNPVLDNKEVEEIIEEFDIRKHAYLNKPFVHFTDLKPMVARVDDFKEQVKTVDSTEPIVEVVENLPVRVPETRNRSKDIMPTPPEAQNVYKKELALQADNVGGQASKSSFGTVFPNNPERSEMFLRVDYLPNKLYKFNGVNWIEVDKAKTDSYTYDEQYILFLIEKLQSGEYEIDQLSASEQELVEEKLKEIADDKT